MYLQKVLQKKTLQNVSKCTYNFFCT